MSADHLPAHVNQPRWSCSIHRVVPRNAQHDRTLCDESVNDVVNTERPSVAGHETEGLTCFCSGEYGGAGVVLSGLVIQLLSLFVQAKSKGGWIGKYALDRQCSQFICPSKSNARTLTALVDDRLGCKPQCLFPHNLRWQCFTNWKCSGAFVVTRFPIQHRSIGYGVWFLFHERFPITCRNLVYANAVAGPYMPSTVCFRATCIFLIASTVTGPHEPSIVAVYQPQNVACC